jgi:cytochrome c biogenesis protein CcdA
MATSLEQTHVKPVRTMPRPPAPGNRGLIFLHALAFVFGFGLVFTLLGSAAGLFGQRLTVYEDIIQRLGAILLVIFGLTTLGVFRWHTRLLQQLALYRETRHGDAPCQPQLGLSQQHVLGGEF